VTSKQVSAEQLAIALMAEARKLRGFTQTPDAPGWTDVAERLAQWANDVRLLGVQYMQALEGLNGQLADALAKLEKSRAMAEYLASGEIALYPPDFRRWLETLK
jgi:hypothetical protein